MKWLTISQIKRRSKTAKGALKVSYEHWCQLYSATAKELREAYQNELSVDNEDCGLCIYYCHRHGNSMKCSYCPLKSCYLNTLYDVASRELDDWYDEEDNGDWHSWKRACKALRDKLKELMQE